MQSLFCNCILKGTMNNLQLEAATKNMREWLAHPSELGKPPYKIEFTKTFEMDNMTYYIF